VAVVADACMHEYACMPWSVGDGSATQQSRKRPPPRWRKLTDPVPLRVTMPFWSIIVTLADARGGCLLPRPVLPPLLPLHPCMHRHPVWPFS
jgi:hypothetical protein